MNNFETLLFKKYVHYHIVIKHPYDVDIHMLQTSKNWTDINIHQASALNERGCNSSTLTYVHDTVSNSSHAADHYTMSCMSKCGDNFNLKLVHPGC